MSNISVANLVYQIALSQKVIDRSEADCQARYFFYFLTFLYVTYFHGNFHIKTGFYRNPIKAFSGVTLKKAKVT